MTTLRTSSRVTLVCVTPHYLLVRFGDAWFTYGSWRELLEDLDPWNRLVVRVGAGF